MSKIECRWCKRMASPKTLKAKHGKTRPECLYYRAWYWMRENDWTVAGRDSVILDLAGVTKQAPAGRPFYWDRNEEVDPETGEVKTSYVQAEIAYFVTVAPKWATTLARKLMDDQELIKRFGRFRLEKRSLHTMEQKNLHALGVKEKGKKMVIPLELRAKIVRIASQSGMTREFAADDLDVVLTIIRDTL